MTTSQTYPEQPGVKKSLDGGYHPAAENVREDLKSIKEGGVALAQHLKDDAQEIAKSAKTEAQRELEDLKSFAGDYLGSLEKKITAKPVQSAAIAFTCGIVLSLLLGRR